MAKDLWGLLASWCLLDIPEVSNIAGWFSWLDASHGSKYARTILEGIVSTMLWSIWKFRIAWIFSMSKPRKADIWDSIVHQSFLWILSRNPKYIFRCKAKVIRLRSHLDKFLVADDDEKTVRQSRNGASVRARWTVEMIEGKNNVIRLKSRSSGKYLTPSSDPFLTGMTGKKVVQDIPANKRDSSMEWEPIKENGLVKLKSKDGKFLRANWGPPPWRNSVTYDLPQRSATRDWVLWGVDVVVVLESQESFASDLSSRSRGSPLASGRQSGMDLFDKAKKVRLQSFHNKYLVADDVEETVRQSRNGTSARARWTVEYLENNPNVIRLKSCHGLYLSATNESFLLGLTGKKVVQYSAQLKPDHTTEWEPVKDGAFHVMLRSCDGKFLRANGGTPPWNNSITHDLPHRTATQNWVLWGVDVVDISLSDTESGMSSLSTVSSTADNYAGSQETGSPRMSSFQQDVGSPSRVSRSFKDKEKKLSSVMECFRKAKTIRLKSYHDKYLLADSDGENVSQDRNSSTNKANWTVEFVNGFDNVIRLKSVHGNYLTASEESKILGVTGQKVVQSLPRKLDSSVEWEPIRDGYFQVRLKTRYGNYLRANGELPPFRSSITHGNPSRHHDWILWDVEIVEAKIEEPPPEIVDADLDASSFRLTTPKAGPTQVKETLRRASVKKEGRMVYYTVMDDDRNVDDDAYEEMSFVSNGRNLEDLTQDLEDLTELEDIIICSRNPLNGKLFPLWLALPPNNTVMHVVVVPSTSKG
ncbi:actin cross-linking [Artemisia annua]|uniref:Actin cross-linking n=1 Tax=Artemisia annua TaxID=35608 RepID=A0A2U1P1I6_ARTAN|nr:actin cross-linking [Artemisia annua]